jgi:hypothetical protein
MRKLLIILPVIFLIGCSLTHNNNIRSIATKELSTLSKVAKAEALLLYAEDYKSRTKADFSKAGLRVVLLTLQNTSSSNTYQINSHDIHGIGDIKNIKKQIDYYEAIESMNSSAQFIKTAKDVEVVRTIRNVAGGAIIGGSIGGLYFGYDLTSLMVASATGAFIGGSYELVRGISGKESYYEDKAKGIIAGEIDSGKLTGTITISPDSKISGILLFPKDVRILTINIKGTTFHVDVH